MFPKLQLILLSEIRSLEVVLSSDFPLAKLAAPLRTELPVEDGLELLLSSSMKTGCFQKEINGRVKESSSCPSAVLSADSLLGKVPLSHGSCGSGVLQCQV